MCSKLCKSSCLAVLVCIYCYEFLVNFDLEVLFGTFFVVSSNVVYENLHYTSFILYYYALYTYIKIPIIYKFNAYPQIKKIISFKTHQIPEFTQKSRDPHHLPLPHDRLESQTQLAARWDSFLLPFPTSLHLEQRNTSTSKFSPPLSLSQQSSPLLNPPRREAR